MSEPGGKVLVCGSARWHTQQRIEALDVQDAGLGIFGGGHDVHEDSEEIGPPHFVLVAGRQPGEGLCQRTVESVKASRI